VNLAQSRVVLRRRTISEILDLAVRLCAGQALGLYVRLALLVLLPCYAACLVLRYVLDWHWIAVWVAAVLSTSLLQGVFTVAAGRWLFSERLGVGEVLRTFAQQVGSYFGAWLTSRFVLTVSTVLLPYAATRMLFVHEASLLERSPFMRSASRASRFVTGAADRAFGMWLALLAAQITAAVLTQILCQGVVDGVLQLGDLFPPLLDELGSPYALLGLMLAVPFVATARFLMYIDLRTRRDGWDIQVSFMAIAAEQQSLMGGAG